MYFVGMETFHKFLRWSVSLQSDILLLTFSCASPWGFLSLPLHLGEWKNLRATLIYFRVSAVTRWHLALRSSSVSLREKRIFMTGKPLRVNRTLLYLFWSFYKATTCQRVSIHWAQNSLFYSQPQAETFHSQAEKLPLYFVLLGLQGSLPPGAGEMLAFTSGFFFPRALSWCANTA